MKKHLLIIAILHTVISGSGQVTFSRIFGPNTSLNSLCENPDSTYACALDSNGAYIVKLNSGGQRVWNKELHIRAEEDASCIWPDRGGYILAGTSKQNLPQYQNEAFVVKLDSTGDTIRTKIFDYYSSGSNGTYGSFIRSTLDSQYIFSIYIDGPLASNGSELMKLDTALDTVWASNGGNNRINSSVIVEDKDSNFVFTYGDQINMSFLRYYKYNKQGVQVASTSIDDTSICFCFYSNSICNTIDSGYLAGGNIFSKMTFFKFDKNLDTLWSKQYNVDSRPHVIVQDADSGFMVLLDNALLHISSTGDSISLNSFSFLQWNEATELIRCHDGGYLIGGTSWADVNEFHAFVFKTDSTGAYNSPVTITGDSVICYDDTVQFHATDPASTKFEWSTGDTTSTINVFQSGIYFATSTHANGSAHTSNGISVTVLTQLTAPYVATTINNDSLRATYSFYFQHTTQWYLNGNPISGATADTIIPLIAGNYAVEWTDTNGCPVMSQPFNFQFTGIENILNEKMIAYPVPADEILYINDIMENIIQLKLYDHTGKIIFDSPMNTNYVDVSELPEGFYVLKVITDRGSYGQRVVVKH